jgi:hypothetical protein
MLVEEHLIDFTALAMSLADMGGDMINRVMPKGAGRRLLCQFLCHCWLSFSVIHWTDVNLCLMSISWSWLAFVFHVNGLGLVGDKQYWAMWDCLVISGILFWIKHSV